MVFGRRIEHLKAIADWKLFAKSGWVSMKRVTSAKAVRDAIKLHQAHEYYCEFHDEDGYRDDSFQFWYTRKDHA